MSSQFSEKQALHRDNTETRSLATNRDRVSVELSGFAQAIFATIAYYDYFNYPLTAAEVYYYLIKSSSRTFNVLWTLNVQALDKPEFVDILKTLGESESLEKLIGHKNGFYFLRDREEIIASRIRRKKLTDQKFKKAKRILKFLSYLPFTRLVMMSGTMAIGNPLKESDIDLLIVAKAGRIWTTRACLTFFTMLFGKYRAGEKTENRLCLNHYITDKTLVIDFGNLYKAEEYLNLIPIAGEMKIYDDFFAANRDWMENYVFSGGDNRENLRTFSAQGIFLKVKNFLEWLLGGIIGDKIEKSVKVFQIRYIENNPLTGSPYSRIRYTDDNLVFHPVLVEGEIIKKYKEKLAEMEANLS